MVWLLLGPGLLLWAGVTLLLEASERRSTGASSGSLLSRWRARRLAHEIELWLRSQPSIGRP